MPGMLANVDSSSSSGRSSPFLIGVSGGTASGKSTVCNEIMRRLGDEKTPSVAMISQDAFYRELTEEEKAMAFRGDFNFDHPNALDDKSMLETLQDLKQGKPVSIWPYDFRTHSRVPKEQTKIGSVDVILVEGILIFYHEAIRKLFDMKLFVDTDPDTRLARRVTRDIQERGRELEQVLHQYLNLVKPAYEEFCLPTKKYADVIIPRGAENQVAIELIVQHIQELLRSPRSQNNGPGQENPASRLRYRAQTRTDMAMAQLPDDATLDKLIKSEFEKARQEVIDLCMEKLPINEDRRTMKIWPRKVNLDGLLEHNLCELPFEFVVDRDPCTGEILAYREVLKKDDSGSGRTSLSLTRAPGPPEEGIMGSTSKFPFFPGGMEEVFQQALKKQREAFNNQRDSLDFENNLLTVPPGFEKGVDFAAKRKAIEKASKSSKKTEDGGGGALSTFSFDENADILSIMGMISGVGAQPFDFGYVKEREKADPQEKKTSAAILDHDIEAAGSIVEEIISKPISVEDRAELVARLTGKVHEFAVVLDVNRPIDDFKEKVPALAHKYPFELDTFQKQAVLHLERGDSVFVAAHTSAGKTVVAEYAIALCKKHLTKAVYTSPIKALSNQKFRDFKQTFQDVGLITGDIQLNNDAFCLIMTTEILRSMLYNGSDTIREVEWVIFDEVHYINDAERGVVWEEVLIMLPRHVKIIMLSATVPNCVEFADWVGRIKDRKVYVISTPKRPVPLEHFLYTGRDGKTKGNLFLLVNKDGVFLNAGYNKAMESVKEKKTTTTSKNPKQQNMNPKTDKNIWITIIDYLNSNDLLPLVAFTFSRKKCDDNAAMLTSVDLTTSQEKSDVHHFFSKCVQQLKGTDRKLPQVLQMQELCKRGLAVHHSGILPILKEVVEMLFQSGHVKVLFATETFAMGVNMPARTVVFDSMQKFDGKCKRDLTAGEYTQMAGRAGRRGKDKTGTVILLCKENVPEMSELHRMMKGKADELVSKFRVTYSLVLNSLRVEKIRIEEILQRSFAERSSLRNVMKRKEELATCKEKLDKEEKVDCSICADLQIYYDTCREIVRLNDKLLQKGFFVSQAIWKQLTTPGRLILFSEGRLRNCLGVFLRTTGTGLGGDKKMVELLIPDTKEAEYLEMVDMKSVNEGTLTLFDLCFLRGQLAKPSGVDSKHSVKLVPLDRVLAFSSKVIKVAPDAIIEDWQRRQQPRFRSSSPDRSIVFALRELQQLISSGPEALNFSDPTKDAQYSDIDLQADVQALKKLRSNLSNFNCVHCLSFKEHFMTVHRSYELEVEYQKLRFESSPESLTHMPEYNKKLEVLKELGYVDENNVVKLKGKVACSMNVFELIVTELLFNNVLGPLTPAEIAAALSFTTCQGVLKKDDENLYLPERLNEIKQMINMAADRIYSIHEREKIDNDDYGDELRFELMEVIFEWAKGTPFCKIMDMTETQEGIIVRCIQRLNEVARDVRNASRIVGDPTLQQKMEDMSALIKRDIVFAASLYTTM